MQFRDLGGPVVLVMTFTSRFDANEIASGVIRARSLASRLPGLASLEIVTDEATATVTMLLLFDDLPSREAFVLSPLYDRLAGLCGMRPGSRSLSRRDLGATGRGEEVVVELAAAV